MDTRDFPLRAASQREILKTSFGFDVSARDEPWMGNSAYFDIYEKFVDESKLWSITKSHEDVLKIVELLQSGSKDTIEVRLKQWLSPKELSDADDIIRSSVNLAARLVLMTSTGPLDSGGRLVLSSEANFNWKCGTLKDFMSTQMTIQKQMTDKVKLERIFNARNLIRIGGIKIRWTNNLADHLRMRDDDTAVEIFHYASFLRFNQTSSILPLTLIQETIRTLALLLPEHDRDLEKWFEKEQLQLQKRRRPRLDPLARECGQLKLSERQIDKFEYYHDRLIMLKQVFDEAEPSNIKQWWHDRRKKVQWYTFWVAAVVLALTIFFGLVQSVEGGMQVWLAMKSDAGSS